MVKSRAPHPRRNGSFWWMQMSQHPLTRTVIGIQNNWSVTQPPRINSAGVQLPTRKIPNLLLSRPTHAPSPVTPNACPIPCHAARTPRVTMTRDVIPNNQRLFNDLYGCWHASVGEISINRVLLLCDRAVRGSFYCLATCYLFKWKRNAQEEERVHHAPPITIAHMELFLLIKLKYVSSPPSINEMHSVVPLIGPKECHLQNDNM